MSIFNEQLLDTHINNYLNNGIKNPILKKVIEEEFVYSKNIESILTKYLSSLSDLDIIYSDNKINSLNTLIKNVSKDNYNFLRDNLTKSFIKLDSDQHVFLIINMNDNLRIIFNIINESKNTSNILKNILSSLSIGLNDNYIVKCIESCRMINKNISDSMVKEYIVNNGFEISLNDTLLAYFLKYISTESIGYSGLSSFLEIKLTSILTHLNTLQLNDMNFAYEIYKIGKIITDSCVKYSDNFIPITILKFKDEQYEYIANSVHTCIINNNIPQAQKIHAIIYYLDRSELKKYIKYYNKYYNLRLKSTKYDVLLKNEFELWNINNEYTPILNDYMFFEYKRHIVNLKYSIFINEDMKKINMSKVTVNLNIDVDNTNNDVKHHPVIGEYIDKLNKYINNRTSLQTIEHSMNDSMITFKTNMGSIKCSLVMGSILLYLQESPLSITEIIQKINISEQNIRSILDILYLNNVVILNENSATYKFIEPYGNVDCSVINIKVKKEIVINRFTDIIMTIDSRIIKEVKPNKMNIMELERRVQEFMGESYVRNIFYNRLDTLKNKFIIKEDSSIIEYVL
jgi:DNA-binding transcriptional regulator GbsR (MarR family)